MKRIFDIAFSLLILAGLSLVILIAAMLVRLKLGAPVFFRQIRPGKDGKPFELLKFRTMLNLVDKDGILLSDQERLTGLGRLLRACSIDELPELWNVLKGEMSLVGPRPLLMAYLSRYTPEQARRHEVRPGITGWAQVNGRQDIRFSKRFEYDVWYVDNQGIFLDLKILFLTFCRVLQRQGVRSGQDIQDVDDLGLSRDLQSKNIKGNADTDLKA